MTPKSSTTPKTKILYQKKRRNRWVGWAKTMLKRAKRRAIAPAPSVPSHKWKIVLLVSLIIPWIGLMYYAFTQSPILLPRPVAQTLFPDTLHLLKAARPRTIPKSIPSLTMTEDGGDRPASDASLAAGLGHFPYSEADPAQLMIIGSYSYNVEHRFERLNQDAGLALMQMIDAARKEGVWLVPVSGFRDTVRQRMLFQLQTKQRGSVAAAAKSVAPPGYSEHHTGYAVDLADGLARAKDLSLAFGETDAYRWLTRHAQEFKFELSFPPDNPQGVIYEPWHWRFVGSPDAARTFAAAYNHFDPTVGN